ncbi:MAG: hypothetical protein WC360_07490 [Opitutales bacterium]
MGQLLRNGQSEARASVLAVGGRAGLLVVLEKLGLRIRFDADAGVLHRYAQHHFVVALVFDDGLEGDAAFGRELQRVGQQVVHYLAQTGGVSEHDGGPFRRYVQMEGNAFVRRQNAVHQGDFPGHGYPVEGQLFQFKAAHFNLGIVQNVVEQLQQGFGASGGCVEVVGLRTVKVGVAQYFQHPHESVDRGADFVAHRGQKGAFGVGNLLGPCLGFEEAVEQRFLLQPEGDVLFQILVMLCRQPDAG